MTSSSTRNTEQPGGRDDIMVESLPFLLKGSQITSVGATATWGSKAAARPRQRPPNCDFPGSNVDPERRFRRRNSIFQEFFLNALTAIASRPGRRDEWPAPRPF
jgi:hypothetical protein